MDVKRADALIWAAEVLGSRIEAEWLLCHALGCSRAGLYADSALRVADPGAIEKMVARRLAGEPLQYITGVQAFRKLELKVGPGVLVPRPETELVVEHCLYGLEGIVDPRVADVGTGSGAIALSLATERPDSQVWATDLSPEALVWANLNLAGVSNVVLLTGDLLSPLPSELAGQLDLVVSNPPYLSETELAETAVEVRDHEPAIALACSDDGMEVPARIVAEAERWLAPGGWLVMETSPTNAARLVELMMNRYELVDVVDDLAGRARIAKGRKR